MNSTRALAAFVTGCVALNGGASADTYKVSDLDSLAEIVGRKAEPGDVVEILPGTYFLGVDRMSVERSGTPSKPIVVRGVIEGGKRPVIDASRVNVRRCVFRVGPGVHDVVFENLEITGARGSRFPDRRSFGVNATAVYFVGCNNVTVRNCVSHHNEDGFFATHSADYILIDNCEIHHNGTTYTGPHNRTHNFYFCAKHQMVKNCYIHHSTEGENFKSRGDNTIFAFNWVDEDAIYSVAVDSGGGLNTLWLGNVVMKRTKLGHGQGRLLGIGDGTGVASGRLVAVNNTFITSFPRDFYLFTERSSTSDAVLINNAFAGPGRTFLRMNGHGTVTGRCNWIASAAGPVPSSLERTLRGNAPGFVDAETFDFRPRAGSPLIGAGVSPEEYSKAIRIVTDNARSGSEVQPSPIWLEALAQIERPSPAFVPVRKGHGYEPRPAVIRVDLGAFPFAAEVD
ncbi:MAG: right-handed parallel beta-helix repeat-containing protein [Planctomycetota bacterium]|jgi:hypothetical protein